MFNTKFEYLDRKYALKLISTTHLYVLYMFLLNVELTVILNITFCYFFFFFFRLLPLPLFRLIFNIYPSHLECVLNARSAQTKTVFFALPSAFERGKSELNTTTNGINFNMKVHGKDISCMNMNICII